MRKIYTAWFKTCPNRAWQYWFWIRVDDLRRTKMIRARDLDGICECVKEIERDLPKPSHCETQSI